MLIDALRFFFAFVGRLKRFLTKLLWPEAVKSHEEVNPTFSLFHAKILT